MRQFKVRLFVTMSFDQGFGLNDAAMATAEAAAAVQVQTRTTGWTDMENSYPQDTTVTPAMLANAKRHPDGDSGPDSIVYKLDAQVQKIVLIEAETEQAALDAAIDREVEIARTNPNGSIGWFFVDAPELEPIHIFGDTATGLVAEIATTDPQDDVVLVRLTKTQLATIRSSVCKSAPLAKMTDLTAALDRAFPA